MSKDIIIQEGGQSKQLTVDKLKTNLVGGGDCLWVPEDGIILGTKHISENGTFRASDDGYFGYSEVTVSGVGTATGRDPTTGEETRVSVDPETGELEETVIPESIRITTLPTKVNYTNGEQINYNGIVVHAYSSTGRDLGAVPFNELVFPVTTALASGDEWADGQGLNAMMLYYTPHVLRLLDKQGNVIHEETVYVHGSPLGVDSRGESATYGGGPGTMFATRYNDTNYLSTVAGDGFMNMFSMAVKPPSPQGPYYQGWRLSGGSSGRAPQGQFVQASFSEYLTDLPASTVDPTTIDPSTLHHVQTIPVQWPCADAGTTLETSFTINVTEGGT